MTSLAARKYRTDAIRCGASQPIPALVLSNARTEGVHLKEILDS